MSSFIDLNHDPLSIGAAASSQFIVHRVICGAVGNIESVMIVVDVVEPYSVHIDVVEIECFDRRHTFRGRRWNGGGGGRRQRDDIEQQDEERQQPLIERRCIY